MKKDFSVKWKASSQPRKQRKYLANAPLHIKHKFMSANLSKELRKKYGRRSFPVRKGDEIKVMRGSFKGKKGKIIRINNMKLRVSVEGLQRQKKDGTKVNVSFNPSKLQITEMNLDDKERIEALGRVKEKVEGKKTNVEQNEESKKDKEIIIKENKHDKQEEKKENVSKKK